MRTELVLAGVVAFRTASLRARYHAIQVVVKRILLSAHDAVTSRCPRRWRFRYAVCLSRIVGPILHGSSLHQRPWRSLDTNHELTLSRILQRMVHQRIGFDPVIDVRGMESLQDGAAILISGHFSLNLLGLRWLYDQGHPVTLLTEHSWLYSHICGIPELNETILPDSHSLINVRGRLLGGNKIGLDIDCFSPHSGSRAIETPMGTVYIRDTIMKLAERMGVPVLFVATHFIRDGHVTANIIRPSSTRAEIVLDEFCRFLEAECAARDQLNT